MSILAPSDIALTQDYVDFARNLLRQKGLSIRVDHDLQRLGAFLASAPGGEPLSNTIDPNLNAILPGESFWISFVNKDEAIVCCLGVRAIFSARDFVRQFVITHRLFGNLVPSLDMYPLKLVDDVPPLSGDIGFGAGGWVHPDWRGQDMYGIMSRLGRVLGTRHYLLDYYIGFTSRKNKAAKSWDWPERKYLLSGMYPGRGKEINVNIVWASKSQVLDLCKKELSKQGFFKVTA